MKNGSGYRRQTKPDVSSLIYGKIPPQALELEESVLGAMMLERDKIDDVLTIIRTPDCFYTDAHQKIYAAIQRIINKGGMVDLHTVPEELRKANELEIVGGTYYLMKLTSAVVSSAHVEDHARIVVEKHLQREVIRICGKAIGQSYDDSEDVFDILDEVQGDFAGIVDHIRSGAIKHIGASLKSTVMDMFAASHQEGDLLGLPTGLTKLDTITLGLSAPDLIIIAAGTGEGKTTLALNLTENIASNEFPGLFFSLEMRDRQLIWKILSGKIDEDIKSIRRGKFSTEKWQRLEKQVMPSLSALPIYMYDQGGINIIELKAIARTAKKKHGIRFIVVDYIQLVRGAGKKFGTREEEVNFVSKELKSLAMELDVPIIALSQLNRIEKGAKRMYKLSDLRESGAIEQDADGVIFIYRPTEHDEKEMKIGGQHMEFTETDALIDIAKWRLGETGTFRVRFDGAFNKFSDYIEPQAFSSPSAGFQNLKRLPTDYSVPQSNDDTGVPF